MKIVTTITACTSGGCPAIFIADDGQVVVRGYTTTATIDVPDGEALVEIPLDLLAAYAAHLDQENQP